MDQPLAHLYFFTILEYLSDRSKTYPFPDVIKTAKDMCDACADTNTPPKEKLMLYIELQAVIQMIAKHLAEVLDPSEPAKITTNVYNTRDAINKLMSDPSTGSVEHGGLGIAVAYHRLKMLQNSPFEFTNTLLRYEQVFLESGIDCLKSFINEQLKVQQIIAYKCLQFSELPTLI